MYYVGVEGFSSDDISSLLSVAQKSDSLFSGLC